MKQLFRLLLVIVLIYLFFFGINIFRGGGGCLFGGLFCADPEPVIQYK